MPGSKFNQIANPPIKKPANVSEDQWQKALELYKTAKSMGDAYPELTVAQAALETGWFKSMAGDYNYFGQKAGKNQKSVSLRTKEQGENGLYSTTASFRNYDSLTESLGDRLNKWSSKYKDAKTADEALDIVVKNGYATARNYKSSVGSILNSITGNKTVYSSQPKTDKTSPEMVLESERPSLPTSSVPLETSTAKYQEPKQPAESNEVAQAKQEINEKNFVQDLSNIFQEAPVAPQQQEDFQLDPSAYNYINEEEY